jgi:hypothetical protein
MTGFDTYLIFQALKCHFFREDYDYFRYSGKLKNHDWNAYAEVSEREKRLYEKFGKKYSTQSDLEAFFVSNLLLTNNKVVIAQLNDGDALANYYSWRARTSAIENTLLSDLRWLLSRSNGSTAKQRFDSLFHPSGAHTQPPILLYLLRQQITTESFLALDLCLEFFSQLNRFLLDDLIWSNVRYKCNKYRPFFQRLIDRPEHLTKSVRQCVLECSTSAGCA